MFSMTYRPMFSFWSFLNGSQPLWNSMYWFKGDYNDDNTAIENQIPWYLFRQDMVNALLQRMRDRHIVPVFVPIYRILFTCADLLHLCTRNTKPECVLCASCSDTDLPTLELAATRRSRRTSDVGNSDDERRTFGGGSGWCDHMMLKRKWCGEGLIWVTDDSWANE